MIIELQQIVSLAILFFVLDKFTNTLNEKSVIGSMMYAFMTVTEIVTVMVMIVKTFEFVNGG